MWGIQGTEKLKSFSHIGSKWTRMEVKSHAVSIGLSNNPQSQGGFSLSLGCRGPLRHSLFSSENLLCVESSLYPSWLVWGSLFQLPITFFFSSLCLCPFGFSLVLESYSVSYISISVLTWQCAHTSVIATDTLHCNCQFMLSHQCQARNTSVLSIFTFVIAWGWHIAWQMTGSR